MLGYLKFTAFSASRLSASWTTVLYRACAEWYHIKLNTGYDILLKIDI